jgi:hypothetical protein
MKSVLKGVNGTNGTVTINEAPSKSKLFRFCEKKIDQWLESHAVDSPAEFSVSFTEEDEAKQISCVTEISMGGKTLRGCDVDVDSQAAFLHSLKHLHSAQLAL